MKMFKAGVYSKEIDHSKSKIGNLPDSDFEFDLDFNVKDTDKKYSKETLEQMRQFEESLKQHQKK